MDELLENTILIKTEINTDFSDCDDIIGNSLPTKCGLIFICADSTFYINCIVENCQSNRNFFEINNFFEHLGTSHNKKVLDNIINKIEPIECINTIDSDATEEINKDQQENGSCIFNDENPNNIEDKNNLQCNICQKLFLKPSYLRKHLKRHSVEPKEKISCSYCSKTFKHSGYLRSHMVVHNRNKSNILQKQVEIIKIDSKQQENDENNAEKVEVNSFIGSPESTRDLNNSDLENDNISQTENILTTSTTINVENNTLDLETSSLPRKLTRTCHICNKTFHSRKYLRRHIRLHSNIKPVKIIPCPKCNKEFKYEHHLRFHMVVHDTEHKCSDCDQKFESNAKLQKHLIRHLGIKSFKCDQCCSKFTFNKQLQIHIKKIHIEKIYSCSECKEHFCNNRQLDTHKLNVHGIYIDESTKLETPKEKKSIHKCDVCTKIFKTNKILKRHMRIHITKSADPIPCPKCKKAFKYEHHLKMHLVAHEKIHKCSECGKIYANRPSLLNHLEYHSGEKKLKCEHCETWCFTKLQLKRHVVDVHGEKKYECEHCGKKFKKKYCLIGHVRIHTKEKPLVCEICGKNFYTPFLLNNHLKRHNNQRDFKCTFDGCNKNFFTRVALVDHEVTHTKLKPYFCAVEGCNSRFTLRSGLVKHKKLHSNVKNYICKICGKAYAQSPGLYAHMKTHGQPLPTS